MLNRASEGEKRANSLAPSAIPEVVLAPASPLAVIDVAVRTAGSPTRESFWLAALGYPETPSADRDGLSNLVERWCTGQVALAACCVGSEGLSEAARDRFSETWTGGLGAADARTALQWVLAGLSEGRFERAVLGAISPSAETWLVLTPLDAARITGLRVLASWGEPLEPAAISLVTGVGEPRREIEAGISAVLPAEPPSLPARTLWMPPVAIAAEALGAFTACAAAVLAVAHRTLPPSRGPDDWHGPRERGFGQFPRPRPWLFEPGRTPRTALALIAGEGGVRALSFSDADGDRPDPLELAPQAHLFVLSAPSEAGLRAEVEALRKHVTGAPPDMGAVAAANWSKPRHRHRCAIVASRAADLTRGLETALARLGGVAAQPSPRERVLIGASEYAGAPVAFVIPGQGPQYAGMLRELALASPAVRRALERVGGVFAEEGTSLAPRLYPAKDVIGTALGGELEGFWRDVTGGGLVGCAASQALLEFLATYGVRPAMLVGHSIGETTVLTLAGALGPMPPEHIEGLARAVGGLRADLRRLSQWGGDAGVAVSGVDRARVERALAAQKDRAFLALDNCPHQVVLLGERSAIEAIAAELRAEGAALLAVSLGAPFHTPLFARASASMSAFYDRLGVRAPQVPVWSGAANAPFPDAPSEVKSLLLRQWAETVRFSASVRALYDRGIRVFVEVGPGETLSGFIDDTLSDRDHLAVACDSPWFGGVEHLLAVLGRLFVAGIEVSPIAGAEARPIGRTLPPARDAVAAIRAGHAALMRELEASRARVLGILPATGRAEHGRSRAGGSAFPALGPRRDVGDGSVTFERRLTLGSDPYLRDHLFGRIRPPYAGDLTGLPVVPMAMTLEMLAEAGLAAASPARRAWVTKVERVRLHRWLTLDRGYLDVRLVARLRPDNEAGRWRADVELFELHEAAPAGRWSAAEATVVVAAALPPALPGRRLAGQPSESGQSPERYRRELVFQGPSFRGFERALRLTSEGIEASVVTPPRDRLFAGDAAPALATAANLMDASGQAIARWAVDYQTRWDGIYPFFTEYEQFAPLPAPGERLHCVALVQDDGSVVAGDVEFQRADGTVLFRYLDFRQRRFSMTAEIAACVRTYDVDYEFSRPFDAGVGLHGRLLDGGYHDIVRPERAIFLLAIAHTVLTARERETWRTLPPIGPRRARWLMGRVAAKEAIQRWVEERHGRSLSPIEVEIGTDQRGKPAVSFFNGAGSIEAPELSISHGDTMAIAVVAADVSVGVDIEEERDGSPRTVPELAFVEGELATAARAGAPPIALWCAKEAAAKALGVGLLGEPRRWRVRELAPDGRTAVVQIEDLRVPVTLHRTEHAIVAVAQVPRPVAAAARETLRVAKATAAKPA
ncbi:MAG TPA: acyltransferase domain-containing protein [Stellaceae bacterium]|nr:acyltransferase domain-containing protein [Stellaceae bacterium]